ncbi:MAG: VIT1/CCC1 transporter family protein [Patescibacteria group bacterium]
MFTPEERRRLAKEWKRKANGKDPADPDVVVDWHNQEKGQYLADAVFAANDGIITTFAVVAGIAGAELSANIVIVLGVASLLADAASMGLGNYLGQKSEESFIRQLKKKELWEIEHVPEKEKAEVREIFAKKGFTGPDLDRVVEVITSDKKVWVDTMLKDELGVIEETDSTPIRHGIVTWVSFIIAGFLPLIPYFIPGIQENGFSWSIGMTFAALFTVGALRTRLVDYHWFRAGFEMLFVGGIAAVIAYGVGAFLATIV